MVERKRAAIYLRVSTDDQSTENQRPDVDRLITMRGLEVVATYEEHGSAMKHRPAFARMITDAHRGAFDVLVVWALDRFGRSMSGNIRDVLELDRRGVLVVSVREPWLDTSGPVRDLLLAIFSWVAEQERNRLVERTKAGLERARRQGKVLGRRPVRINMRAVERLRSEGKSLRAIAGEVGVKLSTLHAAMKRSEKVG